MIKDLYKIECKGEAQEIVRKMLSHEICGCVSMLVDALGRNPEACKLLGIDYDDEVLPLTAAQEYVEPLREAFGLRYLDKGMCVVLQHVDDRAYEYLLDAVDSGGVDIPGVERYDLDDQEQEAGEKKPERWAAWQLDMLRKLDAALDDQADLPRELCDLCRVDSEDKEVYYEHWQVSDWLARKLGARGEIVGDIDLLPNKIWGRRCSGQSIYMDSVMWDIANSLDLFDELQKDDNETKS